MRIPTLFLFLLPASSPPPEEPAVTAGLSRLILLTQDILFLPKIHSPQNIPSTAHHPWHHFPSVVLNKSYLC